MKSWILEAISKIEFLIPGKEPFREKPEHTRQYVRILIEKATQHGSKKAFLRWLLACRPKTLTASLIPISVGAALAFAIQGQVHMGLNVLALLSAIMIQIGTNLINDAYDFKKGADTEERLGPKRLTYSDKTNPRSILFAGLLCFFLAVLLAIPIVMEGGLPFIVIGICSLIAGYSYTGGPFPLAYLGLGDLFVVIFYGWVAVNGIYFLNTGVWDKTAWIAGTQIGLLATVLIAINNLRDHQTDRKANKRTLAVRLGPTFVRWEIALLSLCPFLLGYYWVLEGLQWAFILPLLTLPLSIRLIRNIASTEPSVVFNGFLAQSAAIHLLFGILLSIGLSIK